VGLAGRWGFFVGWLLTTLFAAAVVSASDDEQERQVINIRVGLFPVPPYVFMTEEQLSLPNGAVLDRSVMRGLAVDLTERLSIFAREDSGVDLQFTLGKAPYSYDGSLTLISNDCNSTVDWESEQLLGSDSLYGDLFSETTLGDHPCDRFDIIAGDYYGTAARSLRIDYSPPYLHGAISVCKYRPIPSEDDSAVQLTASGGFADATNVVTMSQASADRSTVCVLESTSTLRITKRKFPGVQILACPSQVECVEELKQGNCILYVEDSLQLKYLAQSDPSLIVSQESFNPQYIYWIMNERSLPASTRRQIEQWMYLATQNGTVDELYETYFEKQSCPLGRTGADCELPCDPNNGNDVGGICVCRSVRYQGVDCSEIVPEETHLIPVALKGLAYGLLGVSAIIMIGCVVWLYLYRHSPQVQMAQPYFLLLVLLGCAISSSAIIAMAQEDDGDGPVHACMAIPWLYSVGFCVTFGTLFAKIWRIYKIFKSSAEMRRVQVTLTESLQVIGSVLLLDVVILTVWTVWSPLEWTRVVISEDQFGESLESEGYCTSEHWGIFGGLIGALHAALLAIASYLCYVSRNIPTKFSEGKYLSVAMVSNLQIFIVGVPVLIVVGSEPATSFFVRSVVVWMNDIVVVILIFGNLIKSVLRFEEQDSKNVKKKVKEDIRNAISEFSRLEHLSDTRSHQGDEQSHYSAENVPSYRQDIAAHSQRLSSLESINKSWQKEHSSDFTFPKASDVDSDEPHDMSRDNSNPHIPSSAEAAEHDVSDLSGDMRFPNVHKMSIIESKSDILESTSSTVSSGSSFRFRSTTSKAAMRELEIGELQELSEEEGDSVGGNEAKNEEDRERFVLDPVDENE